MQATEESLTVLEYDEEPGRRVRIRVEGPAGYRERREGLPYVLLLHGFKGFMHWGFFPELSRRIARAGMVAISFNFSGSGVGEELDEFTEEDAFARNTYSRELEDVEHVRRHVASGAIGGVDIGRAAMLGHSRGGGIALLHAAEDGGYRSIVTWAAIADVDRFGEEVKNQWRERGWIAIPNARTGQVHRIELDILDDVERNRERLDIQRACGRIHCPVLVVHGSDDTSVDYAAAEHITTALPEGVGRLLRVEGEGHTFGVTHPMGEMPNALERVCAATTDHFQASFLPPRP